MKNEREEVREIITDGDSRKGEIEMNVFGKGQGAITVTKEGS